MLETIRGTTKDILQRVILVPESEKESHLLTLLTIQPQPRTIVFLDTKRKADNLDDVFYNKGYPCISLHGDRNQRERQVALHAFKAGKSPILITTPIVCREMDTAADNPGLASTFYKDRNTGLAPQLTKISIERQQDVSKILQVIVDDVMTFDDPDFVEEDESGGLLSGGQLGSKASVMILGEDLVTPRAKQLVPAKSGHGAGRVAKYTGKYITGKSPAKQPYMIGASVAMLYPLSETVSIRQYRSFMSTCLKFIDVKAGLGSEARRAKWATRVEGQGWQGYWIPFQDQLTPAAQGAQKEMEGGKEAVNVPSSTYVGTGCDVVLLAVHGGGFIDGKALMFLDYFRKLMRSVQKSQGIKIGILSVEYGLSPENPYPVALDEITAAYRGLVRHYGVESKRIILFGDSAGGNLCLSTSIKLRDAFADMGSPAGHVLICPWVRGPEPLESSLYDLVNAAGCEMFVEAYTQNNPEVLSSPYTSPFNTPTLAGLSPMLVFMGGVEILRPSIEHFVEKARADGVDVQAIVGEGRSHNYFLLNEISTNKDREESYLAIGDFVLRAHRHRLGLVE
ncbi:hypothetical protein BGX33_012483 [Mortierella sp. NVP41]|nr:hypothetical protein BGX33_012483 [Mortierella sp. NVP41]